MSDLLPSLRWCAKLNDEAETLRFFNTRGDSYLFERFRGRIQGGTMRRAVSALNNGDNLPFKDWQVTRVAVDGTKRMDLFALTVKGSEVVWKRSGDGEVPKALLRDLRRMTGVVQSSQEELAKRRPIVLPAKPEGATP